MSLRADENGIPRVNRTHLEERAEKFLSYFVPECLTTPKMVPICTIAQKMADEDHLKLVFNAELGCSPEGYRYRGRFHIPSKTIYIDTSLCSYLHKLNFTLAHEISHFLLHRNINMEVLGSNSNETISDTSRDLILDHVQENGARKWVEWQANSLAASILMPRATVLDAVINVQAKMGINRNIGTVYLDRQSTNYQAYKELIENLKFIYQVSESALRIRLQELNVLVNKFDTRKSLDGPRDMKNILSTTLGFFDE